MILPSGDPSPGRGLPPDRAERLAGVLADRLQRAVWADSGLCWGIVLSGVVSADQGDYAHLVVVTPRGSVVPLTRSMIDQTVGRSLYLLGCCRTRLAVPPIAAGLGPHDPLPMVAIRSVIGCTNPVIGGGQLEATVTAPQAAATPIHVLTVEPIPGWPR